MISDHNVEQTLEIVRRVFANRACRPIAADVVEFVPAPHPPGCDLAAARLAAKAVSLHVFATNVPAIRLYERLGYECTRSGEGGLQMSRTL